MTRQEALNRARALVKQMTIDEKATQLSYISPAIKRLDVPHYNWWNESLHGVARAGVATSFPQAIGMAASFDVELIAKVADVCATEGRAKYNAFCAHNDRGIYKGLTFWSPNVNIFRDPRWGRGHETYGEDPYLTGCMGISFVKGLQGDGAVMKAAACAKHFAVHSGPEADRHYFDAVVNKKDMFETYLPAFKALVMDAKVEAVMGAYNRVNGEVSCASPVLMTDILRGDWGFEGHYVSDCWAIRDFHENHKVTKNFTESAAMAINEGCDLNCGNTYLHIMKAYNEGLVSEATMTTSVERLYTTRFLLGLFDESEFDEIPYSAIECKEHLELADTMTEKGMVLLKNNGILPLDKKDIASIGVVGPNANSRVALVGNYHGTSSEYVTVLEGIKEYVKDDARVYYAEGTHLYEDRIEELADAGDRMSEAITVTEYSDVVIVCVGLDETLEGEEGDTGNSYASGDKGDLNLPKVQCDLIEAVGQIDKPKILCLNAGSAIDLTYAKEHYDAIVLAWYPGARGGRVIAKALFGEVAPSGKLPITFYHSIDDLPEFEDYSMKGRTYRYIEKAPLYPFGYGLTYGSCKVESFEYSDGEVSVVVGNEGQSAVSEVVQVYVKNMESSHDCLNPKLCGFKRVDVSGAEAMTVTISLDQNAFKVVNDEGDYVIDGNKYRLYVGFGQPDALTTALYGNSSIEKVITT